ncbi:flagellar basal body P-ring protein FlgI [Telmatospirillum sp.]|uniref:flagellar basal body P-ring protein FlgI n=1 Tax=Telmatospirillum sp. TaxID=2079197 RepID=UPI00283B5EA7|nr:flagellar basal body P-ring protein FlgI [Telmatospirillum sp.]MDR3438099.1 flagellar basal body P-ring protein FlgI [Telmatospirillum sp.]
MTSSFLYALLLAVTIAPAAFAQETPIKALGRFDGWRDNALVGYGLVTGLSGTGDSRSSNITRQALRNALSRLGTTVSADDISSRNVAVVMVTAVLPASANVGDRIDVTVSSVGDARSIAGGTLLMTTLAGPDQQVYALAQGPLLVGGYQFDAQQNAVQRNFPTTGRIAQGASVEQAVNARIANNRGEVTFILAQPDFATAQQIATAVNQRFGPGHARVDNADKVVMTGSTDNSALAGFVASVETISVRAAQQYRVVVNEKTGTVVAGGDIKVSPVVISQGDLRVTIETRDGAWEPYFTTALDGGARHHGEGSRLAGFNTKLTVEEGKDDATIQLGSTTIGDLVQGLNALHVGTRRLISILQALKTEGALHADLIVE